MRFGGWLRNAKGRRTSLGKIAAGTRAPDFAPGERARGDAGLFLCVRGEPLDCSDQLGGGPLAGIAAVVAQRPFVPLAAMRRAGIGRDRHEIAEIAGRSRTAESMHWSVRTPATIKERTPRLRST